MPDFELRVGAEPPFAAVLALYAAVGWTAGIGRALLTAVATRYAHVRQHVLLTDDEPGQRAFYERPGYAETRDFGDGTLRAFVRFARDT